MEESLSVRWFNGDAGSSEKVKFTAIGKKFVFSSPHILAIDSNVSDSFAVMCHVNQVGTSFLRHRSTRIFFVCIAQR
jgi:hypothetical protein